MGIKSVYKRAEYGRNLYTQEAQGQRSIGELQRLRQTLPALRAEIVADPELSSEERADALTEVDATIGKLISDIKAFADGL